MDSLEKTPLPRKTRSEPTIKTAKKLKINDHQRSQKSKMVMTSYSGKPVTATKAISETNVRKAENRENIDNYKEKQQKIKTKEFSIVSNIYETTSEGSESEMEEENKIIFSTIGKSQPNIIPLDASGHQSNNVTSSVPTEDSSEDEQWEIIRIPYSSAKWLPNDSNTQTVVNTNVSETDNDAIGTDNVEESSSSLDVNFDENMDLEETCSNINLSEILLDEIESQTSTVEENDSTDLAPKGNNTNLPQCGTEESNVSSGARSNSNQKIYEECLQRIKMSTAGPTRSNLKICNHSKPNSNLLLIKPNRSKLNNSNQKYSVINMPPKSSVRTSRNEHKELRTFVLNTMKVMHPELHIKDDIGMRLQVFLLDILNRIGDEAKNLVTLSSKKEVDKRALKYAIKLSLDRMKNEADVASGKRNQWLF